MDNIDKTVAAAQSALPNLKHRAGEPLERHTSFKVGGPVRAMFFPTNAFEMSRLCELLCGSGISPLILGNGTNILASDKPLNIIAIKTTGIDGITQTGETELAAGCGASLARLADFASERGLAGLEFASGIPGSVGGAVYMNAGAYGGSMEDVVHSSACYSPDRSEFALTADEHRFAYRSSVFTDSADIILQSTLKLTKSDKESIKARMGEFNARRRDSQPLDLPSAGSTFKRPESGYAAALIEQAGLKGYTVGAAQVSKKHSGFIVNLGGAKYDEIIAVIEHVRETVLRHSGISLEPEVKIIGSPST